MRTHRSVIMLGTLIVALIASNNGRAQGTITFDQPSIGVNETHFLWFYTDSSGMYFSISPQVPDNYLERLIEVNGHPSNDSPHLEHTRFWPIQSLATFNLTNASVFGLVSVDLADPVAPSLSPVTITFNGYRADNSMVSQTFTVGGSGSSAFQTFTFGPDFAHGLLRVEMPSPAWAMDNIVWVPEPSTHALLGLGLLAFAARRFIGKRKL